MLRVVVHSRTLQWLISIYCCFFSFSSFADSRTDSLLNYTEHLKLLHPDSAYTILKDVLRKTESNGETVQQACALQQIGSIFFHHASFNQALEQYLKADKLFRQANRKDLLAKNLDQLGNLYYANRDKNAALQYYHEALPIYRNINDTDGIAETYGLIGHICEKNTRPDSALAYQRIALGYYLATDNKDGIADIYENIASVYEDVSKNDSALFYYTKALGLYIQNRDIISQANLYNNLGDIYRKTGDYKEGLRHTRIALQLALQTNDPSQINSAYNDISKAYNLMGINDSAYYYNALSRKTLLSIYTEENSRQVAFTQSLFDAERKNSEIQQLENARHVEQIVTIAVSVIIVLVILLALVTINRQRLKIRTQHDINEQERKIYEANKILMETDLRNKQLAEENLKNQLEDRNRELTTHTLNVIQKNEQFADLKERITDIIKDDKRDHKRQLKAILQQIDHGFDSDTYWQELNTVFEQVHQSFFDNLRKHTEGLTSAEIRLATLLKMNLNSADMARLLGISTDSLRIARYRLRKKLRLEQGANLTSFIQSL